MRAGIAAFSCGVILLYWNGVVPPSSVVSIALVAFAAILLLPMTSFGRRSRHWIAFTIVGFVWASWSATGRLQNVLPADLEGPVQTLSGYVCDIPSPGAYHSVRFSLCVQEWTNQSPKAIGRTLPGKLRLAWYGKQARLDLPHHLTVQVRLKKPHGIVNPAGFRYESWLFRHHLGATGSVQSVQPWAGGSCFLVCQYHAWRIRLAGALEDRFGHLQHFALVEALLIGQRGYMSSSDWATLKATGTIHLVAISGLHIGLIAVGLGLLVRMVVGWLPQSWLAPSRKRGWVFGAMLVGSIVYALAAGFTVPTRRALVMLMLAGWLVLRAGRSNAWQGWLVAVFLVLLLDPVAPLGRGFWLSFMAVALLIVAFSGRLVPPSGWKGLLIAQCAVFAGLWPVLHVMDQPPAAIGWLANLVAIPCVSLLLLPVLVIGAVLSGVMPQLTPLIGQVFDTMLGLFWWFLEALAAMPVPALTAPLWIALAVAVLALLAIVYPVNQFRLAALSAMLAWGLVQWGAQGERASGNTWMNSPEVWVWDVGQGLSVMVRDQGQVLIYDTGPESPSGYSAVDAILMPNLRALGIHRIDTLILSHADADHAGGLASLFQSMTIGTVVSGEPAEIAAGLEPTVAHTITPCRSPSPLTVGRIEVTLWALAPENGVPPEGNDASCVALVRFQNSEVILPGDITRSTERTLVRSGYFKTKRHRVLVAAHHGSKSSSDDAWVAAIKPDVVIYSAGYRHRYGHPHPAVMKRFERAGAQPFNTAYTGALRITLDTGRPVVDEWRSRAPFWIAPARQTPLVR